MLNLYQLHLFVLVAEARSLAAVADQLGMTAPGIGFQIRSFERSNQVTLFDRTRRRMEPTEAAREFLPVARELLRLGNQAEEVLAQLREGRRPTVRRWNAGVEQLDRYLESVRTRVSGQVVLGCGVAFNYEVLYRLMGAVQGLVPDLTIKIERGSSAAILQRVQSGQVDFGLVCGRPRDRRLRGRRVLTDEVVLLTPRNHQWSDQTGVRAADLASAGFVVQGQEPEVWRLVGTALGRCGISIDDLPVAMQVDTAHDAVAAVEQGLGVTFLSNTFVRSESSKSKVVPIEDVRIGREIVLVHRPEDYLSPGGRRLEAFLRAPLVTKVLAGEE